MSKTGLLCPAFTHTHTRTLKRTLCSVKFCFCLLFETFPRKLFRVLDSCRAHRARSDCVAFNIPFCSVSFQVFPATSNSNLLPLPLPVKILWKMRMRAASFQLKKVRDQHRHAAPLHFLINYFALMCMQISAQTNKSIESVPPPGTLFHLGGPQ